MKYFGTTLSLVVVFVVANLLTILLILSVYQSLVNAFKRTFVYRTVDYIFSRIYMMLKRRFFITWNSTRLIWRHEFNLGFTLLRYLYQPFSKTTFLIYLEKLEWCEIINLMLLRFLRSKRRVRRKRILEKIKYRTKTCDDR